MNKNEIELNTRPLKSFRVPAQGYGKYCGFDVFDHYIFPKNHQQEEEIMNHPQFLSGDILVAEEGEIIPRDRRDRDKPLQVAVKKEEESIFTFAETRVMNQLSEEGKKTIRDNVYAIFRKEFPDRFVQDVMVSEEPKKPDVDIPPEKVLTSGEFSVDSKETKINKEGQPEPKETKEEITDKLPHEEDNLPPSPESALIVDKNKMYNAQELREMKKEDLVELYKVHGLQLDPNILKPDMVSQLVNFFKNKLVDDQTSLIDKREEF